MSENNEITTVKVPLYFRWTIRLLLLIFFPTFLVLSEFSGELPIELIFAVFGYTTLTILLNLSPWLNKRAVQQVILLADAFLIGYLAVYGGIGIATLALSAAILVIWLTSQVVLSPYYILALYLGGGALSYNYAQMVDFSIWGPAQQISVALVLSYSILGLLQLRRELGVANTELSSLQNTQAGLKLKNYQIAKYLPAPLRERISRVKEVEANTSRKKLTVFFSDLVGFSQISEEMEPNDLSKLLDSYLSEMAEIADQFGATVDKFIGDGIMIFFGDPKTRGTKEDAEACVAMALEMQRRMNLLQIKWRQEGIDRSLQVRKGINSGFCTVGNFGSNDRMNYTAVGTEVNLASRLETAAEPGEVLVSSSTFLLVQDKYLCKSRGDVSVKGFADPVPVYSAVGKRAELDRATNYLNFSSAGFSINIDTDAIPTYDRKKVMEALQKAGEIVKRNFRN